MIKPYRGWWHAIIGTRNSWLPGDPRGFRNHHHRVHSSGDYRSPPPIGEHDGLFRYNLARAGQPLVLTTEHRRNALEAIREAATYRGVSLLAISVGDVHAHLIIQANGSYADCKRLVGGIKTGSSYILREQLPGRIWSSSSSPKPIKDRSHLEASYVYITKRQERGAVTFGDLELWARVREGISSDEGGR